MRKFYMERIMIFNSSTLKAITFYSFTAYDVMFKCVLLICFPHNSRTVRRADTGGHCGVNTMTSLMLPTEL